MRNSTMLFGAAAALAGCGQSSDNAASTNTAAVSKPRPAYCFFKDSETKNWAAKPDKSGNVVVTGKAYREDSRYKAYLAPATVSGSTAEVAPTIGPNDTGFGAPGDWWSVSETIPASQGVQTVVVKCGDETLAKLEVAGKK